VKDKFQLTIGVYEEDTQFEDEEEQQRRDEKNGLYPDREDITN